MRILLTTRGSAGHLNPLAPFGHAALRAGHEVLVAAQGQHAGNVERAGLPFAPFGEPPPEQWMPLLAEFGEMDLDTANAVMIGEYFARMDTAAALPGLRAIVEDFRPDVILRDCWEYASTLVAELHGDPGRPRRARARGGRGALDRPGRGRRGRGAHRTRPAARPGRRPAARDAVPHDAGRRRSRTRRRGRSIASATPCPTPPRRCPTGGPATTTRSSTSRSGRSPRASTSPTSRPSTAPRSTRSRRCRCACS